MSAKPSKHPTPQMPIYNRGIRIGAMLSATTDTVQLLGYGVYLDDEVPPKDIGGMNIGLPNPKLKLDNGDIVWGCECWWGPEEKIKAMCAKPGMVVEQVAIADWRTKKP